MADKWGANMKGVQETLKHAETMGINLRSCARTACLKLAGKIASQAKRNVQTLVLHPGDEGYSKKKKSKGRLAGSITIASNFINSVFLLNPPAKPEDGLQAPGGNKEDAPFAIAGTNVVYSRRIEHGFVGKDSLGRSYNQAPKPYLYPAFFAYENDLPETFMDVVNEKMALENFNRRLPVFDPSGAED